MIQEEEQMETKKWYKDSVLVKLSVIAVLILALLIPSSWIQSLITEREETQQSMRGEIADKWSGKQLVQGPVLMLPYKKTAAATTFEVAYILPENLNIKANVKTEMHHRGIIDATSYTSKILLNGNFARLELAKLGIDPSLVSYDKAKLIFSISDLKGLKSNPSIKIQNQDYTPEPTYNNDGPFNKGLQVAFAMQKDTDFNFSYTLDLKGTDELSFLHIGKTTDVEVTSDWDSPSYSGRHLPDTHTESKRGFDAKWRMLFYNRPFPQQWTNSDTVLVSKAAGDAVFGVKFSLPVDQYRKTMRTTKYSTLIILLTFVSLFLTELIRKQNIHLFNYILIGAAMVVYYTLLLSFAEHLGYDVAYLISSVSTITLIAWFTSSLMGNSKIAILFGAILSVFYGFIYVLIQLEELSLVIGSCALFIIVALLMYFSRKINWEKH